MTLDEIKFTLRISQEMSNRLDEIAKREDLSKNQVVRKALRNLFEEFEEKEKERKWHEPRWIRKEIWLFWHW